MKSTYLLLDIGTILFPLLLSFDKKVAFWRKWKFLFPAMILVAIFFLVWDYMFTLWGVWGFTPAYITGAYLGNLPLEEVTFFLVVPYACVFVYECLKAYFPSDPLRNIYKGIHVAVMLLMALALIFYSDRLYTAVTAMLLLFFLMMHSWVWRSNYLSFFYLAWIICIVPMLIVNGVLTALPVVWYEPAEQIGQRLGTIPVEDFFYNMLCMLMNIGIYERLQRINKPTRQDLAEDPKAQAS
jgi:lycopene cyclase domain-containing protein